MMLRLHETTMGKALFGHHIPSLVKAANEIAKELKRANDLKEQELAVTLPFQGDDE
jgi:hypothetical protein